MLSPIRAKSFNSSIVSIPDFLLPAFANHLSLRSFSSTTKWASRIGSAPISLPPEVNLRFLEPPSSKRNIVRRIAPPRTLEVEGPLGNCESRHLTVPKKNTKPIPGKLTIPIPLYMSFEQDPETRKATLKIPDKTERKHREMWGQYLHYLEVMLRSFKALQAPHEHVFKTTSWEYQKATTQFYAL